MSYTPFSDGEVVCNIFYPTQDCQTVSGGVDVWLLYGESKIYVPQAKLNAMTDIKEGVDIWARLASDVMTQ